MNRIKKVPQGNECSKRDLVNRKGQESKSETCVFYAPTHGVIFAHENMPDILLVRNKRKHSIGENEFNYKNEHRSVVYFIQILHFLCL